MKTYQEYFQEILVLLEILGKISPRKQKLNCISIDTQISKKIFVKSYKNYCSIVKLFYPLKIKTVIENELDLTSIANLVRSLIESYETLFYLCIERIEREERDFRIELYYYHQVIEKDKILKFIGVDRNYTESISYTNNQMASLYRTKIENNNYFNSLGDKTKQSILKGDTSFYRKPTETRSGKSRLDRKSQDSSLYKLFSNCAHSTSLGIHIANTRINSSDFDANKVICLSMAATMHYMCLVITKYLNKRRLLKNMLNSNDFDWIKSHIDFDLSCFFSEEDNLVDHSQHNDVPF